VANQQVMGSDFIFDLYLLRTGDTPLLLGDCDFVLTFNEANFSNPVASLLSKGLAGNYDIEASLSGNRCCINVRPLFTDIAMAQNISTLTPIGELVAEVMISGIADPEGTAGLNWRNPGVANATILTAVGSSNPLTESDITDPAFHTPPDDAALPVTLTSFTGSINTTQGGVLLEWHTASEVDNSGYTVQRKGRDETAFADLPGAFIPGKGTTTEPQHYSYVDKTVAAAGTYAYRLKQQDLDGEVHYSESIIVDVTVTDLETIAPLTFGLMQNWPNPFNPVTNIGYTVGVVSRESLVAARVRLAVYDLLGREVAVLVDEKKEPGAYVVTFDAAGLASGTYVYRLTTGDQVEVRRMVVLK